MTGADAASQMFSDGKLGAITAPSDRNRVSSIIFIIILLAVGKADYLSLR